MDAPNVGRDLSASDSVGVADRDGSEQALPGPAEPSKSTETEPAANVQPSGGGDSVQVSAARGPLPLSVFDVAVFSSSSSSFGRHRRSRLSRRNRRCHGRAHGRDHDRGRPLVSVFLSPSSLLLLLLPFAPSLPLQPTRHDASLNKQNEYGTCD